jgi:hypothetical protein
MTSKRKAASNRANAQHSSGPRSVAGKRHASRNARKHGLAVPITNDQAWVQRIESLALEIAGNDGDPLRLEEARILAEPELDLTRVAAARTRLLALTGLASQDQSRPNPREPGAAAPPPETKTDDRHGGVTGEQLTAVLKQLLLLDRYDRHALARRNKAIRRLF